MINKTSKGKLVTAGLVDFLESTGQKNLLPEVFEELSEKVDVRQKNKEVLVESAVKLTDKELKKIKDLIKTNFKKDYPIKTKIEKSLLGGFTIKMGDWFVDASLKQDLQNLKHTLQG